VSLLFLPIKIAYIKAEVRFLELSAKENPQADLRLVLSVVLARPLYS